MKDFILFGLPASGKGTQAMNIVNTYSDAKLLSMGNLLRNEAKNNTKIGIEISKILSYGELVSDDLVNNIIRQFVKSVNAKFIVYDGYPRTCAQANYLINLLAEFNRVIDVVFYLTINDKIALSRMFDRLVCASCGSVFNLKYNPPKINGICDICGSSQLIKRLDDSEDILKKRLSNMRSYNNDLLSFYSSNGINVVVIDGSDAIDSIFDVIKKNVDSFF